MNRLKALLIVLLALFAVIVISFYLFGREVKNTRGYTHASVADDMECEALIRYDSKEVGRCYGEKAVATGDSRFCHKRYVDTAHCYTDIAVKDKSLDVCDEITSDILHARCYSAVASAANDVSICNRITIDDVYWGSDSCLDGIAQASTDSSLCANIVDVQTRDYCYTKHALYTSQDVSLCEKITNQQSAAFCRNKYHSDRGDQDCSVHGVGWQKFTQDEPYLSFCYTDTWGEPVVKHTESSSAQTGSVSRVTFTKSRGNFPLVSFSTTDYKRLGDSDVPQFCWDCLDLSLDNPALEKALGIVGEGSVVERGAIASKKFIQIKWDFVDPLSGDDINAYQWFIPKALDNGRFNLDILGAEDQWLDLAKLFGSLSLVK